MLNPTRQRRITFVLLAVCFFYTCLLSKQYIMNFWTTRLRPMRDNPFGNIFNQKVEVTPEIIPSPELYRANCSRIFNGDQAEMLVTRSALTRSPQQVTENKFYKQAAQNCELFLRANNLSDIYSKVPLMFPTAYVITVQHSVQQFNLLMRAIYNEHNVYCVHVSDGDAELRDAMEAVVNCLPQVFMATKTERVVRYDHSELRAEFNCLHDLLVLPINWRYVVNVDETSFPLKTNSHVTDRLKELGTNNIVPGHVSISEGDSVRYKYQHAVMGDKLIRTTNLKTPVPPTIHLLQGSVYYALSRDFVQFIMNNYYSIDFYTWLNDTYEPREIYWATMNQMYIKNQKLQEPTSSQLSNTHYYTERNTPSGQVSGDTLCPGKFEENICVFDATSLVELSGREEFFATKFDIKYDPTPIVCLGESITNIYEYNIYANEKQNNQKKHEN